MPNCSKCGKHDARLLCSRCECTHYCSQSCQVEHWSQTPHPHKEVCRDCRPVGGVFFEGLQKSSILDLASGKGGNIVRKLGYPVITANAMALRVSRAQFVAALRHARGSLTPEWQESLSMDEKQELLAEDPSSEADYVSFASPLSSSAKRSRVDNIANASSIKKSRAVDTTPIKGADLFGKKRERKPVKRIFDEEQAARHFKQSVKPRNRAPSDEESDEKDEETDGELEYTDIKADALVGTESEEYSKVLDRVFEDTEDGVQFRIISICVSSDPALGFFFKYCEVSSNKAEFEYTPCAEIMEATWVKWWPATSKNDTKAS